MRTDAPRKNRTQIYENRCSEKKPPEKTHMRTDAPKNPEKKLYENRCSEKKKLYENRCSEKNPEKNYMRTDDPIKKTQHKQYKHSIRREVLQIKTTARDCANFQYENKGLKKQTTTKSR